MTYVCHLQISNSIYKRWQEREVNTFTTRRLDIASNNIQIYVLVQTMCTHSWLESQFCMLCPYGASHRNPKYTSIPCLQQYFSHVYDAWDMFNQYPSRARMHVSIATTFRWLGYYPLSTMLNIFQLVSGNPRRWHVVPVARGQIFDIPLESTLHVHFNAMSYQMDGVEIQGYIIANLEVRWPCPSLTTRRKLVHNNHHLQLVHTNHHLQLVHNNRHLQLVHCNSW